MADGHSRGSEDGGARQETRDAYGAIIFALDQLRQAGDVHEGFTNPLTAKLEAQVAGGDMYPMLLGVGPLLGDGPLIGFTGRKGFRYYVSYRDGALSVGGYTDRAPVVVPAFSPAPPVAVLTGPTTASSGEAVTVAFRGRANTRSFGAATGGVTTRATDLPPGRWRRNLVLGLRLCRPQRRHLRPRDRP